MENDVDEDEAFRLSSEDRLSKIKELWELGRVVGPLDVDWLIREAGFAAKLDEAGERLKIASRAYIVELQEELKECRSK